jgi:hypothetical protein
LVGKLKGRLDWDKRRSLWIAIAAGLAATLIFDVLTNLALAVSIGPFWPVLIAAIPFAGVHLASNALLFAAIFPILRRWILGSASTVVGPSSI